MDTTERKGLIDQIRKEDYEEFKKYQVGACHNGHILVLKNTNIADGLLLIVPLDFFNKALGE